MLDKRILMKMSEKISMKSLNRSNLLMKLFLKSFDLVIWFSTSMKCGNIKKDETFSDNKMMDKN